MGRPISDIFLTPSVKNAAHPGAESSRVGRHLQQREPQGFPTGLLVDPSRG